jgi:hypothetical protein
MAADLPGSESEEDEDERGCGGGGEGYGGLAAVTRRLWAL